MQCQKFFLTRTKLFKSNMKFFFLMKNFVGVISDLQAVLRNNTERLFVDFVQFSPMVTFYNIIMQYHNQNVYIDTIILFRFILLCLPFWCVSVCVFLSPIQFFHMCRSPCIHHHSQAMNNFYITDMSYYKSKIL